MYPETFIVTLCESDDAKRKVPHVKDSIRLRKNECFSPEYLRPNEHEDVLNDLIKAGDKEVGPKGQAQCPEQGGLLCFLGLHNQDFRLLHSSVLFDFSVCDPLG